MDDEVSGENVFITEWNKLAFASEVSQNSHRPLRVEQLKTHLSKKYTLSSLKEFCRKNGIDLPAHASKIDIIGILREKV